MLFQQNRLVLLTDLVSDRKKIKKHLDYYDTQIETLLFQMKNEGEFSEEEISEIESIAKEEIAK